MLYKCQEFRLTGDNQNVLERALSNYKLNKWKMKASLIYITKTEHTFGNTGNC